MGQTLDKPFNVHIACCNSYNTDDNGEDNVDAADANFTEVEEEEDTDSTSPATTSSCDNNRGSLSPTQ